MTTAPIADCLAASMADLAYANEPQISGVIRERIGDFNVTEHLGFELSGEGHHLWLYVQKQNLNTLAVAEHLAAKLNLRAADIGYSGLKDKLAITSQWFSLPFRGESLDPGLLENQQIKVLKQQQHASKLKRGSHKANEFTLLVRDLQGPKDGLESQIETLAKQGAPNYFGPQRFGHKERNISQARRLFADQIRLDRVAKGLYLSAARAYLFNHVLSVRVSCGNWCEAIEGEAFSLDGSNSYFVPEALDQSILKRLATHDIHPSGPLWGNGALASQGACAKLEQAVIAQHAALAEGLCQVGLKQARRALRLRPQSLSHQWLDADTLQLNFTLPKGTFATSLLREMVKISA